MAKKELNVYYKGTMQKIKYYGNLDEKQLKSTVKQVFKITEPLEQIFFQDNEGDILLINDQIPSGLSVHIFVEPDTIPKNRSKELKVEEKSGLMKFNWILDEISNQKDLNSKVIINKYLYTTVSDNDVHPSVRSSCIFEKGKHFFVLRKPVLSFYSLLLICEENLNFGIMNCPVGQSHAIGIFNGYPDENWPSNDLFTINLGILIDMENKKCVFYDYDKRKRIKIMYTKNNEKKEDYEAPIDFERAKVLAWLKRDVCNRGKIGITILNEGCIPIPDWI